MRHSKAILVLAAIITIVFISASGLLAQTTIHVPSEQPTIQAAIDASQNGDTVLVSAGIYYENINFHGKAITLTSVDGPLETLIDGGGKATVVMFNSGEGRNSVLNGFSIRHGRADNGAGVAIGNSSPTISHNMITDNQGIAGIGICVWGGSPLIKENTISMNVQSGGSGGGGGGILTQGDDTQPVSPTIIGNVISENIISAGGFGGGIEAAYFGRPIIENNTILRNYAFNYGGGINISSYDGAIISQNLILNNDVGVGGSGGGISVYGKSAVNIINNTIIGNTARDQSSGLYIDNISAQTNTIANNIVIAAPGQTAVVCGPAWSSFSPVFLHNDIVSPTGLTSSGVCDLSPALGNISVDPLFEDASAANYHLQADSPLMDAGDNTVQDLPKLDRDGNARLIDFNNDCVPTIDLGAYELQAASAGTLSPSSLVFAAQSVGTTGEELPATLRSTGATCLQISSISISPEFMQENTCGIGVPAGKSCTISVSFRPLGSDLRTGTLAVASNFNGPLTVALSGIGGRPAAEVSPTPLTFGSQFVGTSSSLQQVVISNTGDASLQVSGIGLDGDFFQAGDTCVGSIPPAGSCSFYVAFKPTVSGVRSGSLSVLSDSIVKTPKVSLSVFGITGSPSLSPTFVSFGEVFVGEKVNSRTVILTATGPGPLMISGITVSAGFSLNNKCENRLNAGTSCSIVVSFKPTEPGTVNGSLTIVDSGLGSPRVVALSGTGLAKH